MSFLMRNCFSRGNWPTSSWGPHEETDFPRGPHEAFSTRNLIPHEYLMRFTVSNFFSRGNWPTFSWAAHEAFSTRNFDSLIVIVRFCMRNIFDGENDLATFLWGLPRGPHEAFSTRKLSLNSIWSSFLSSFLNELLAHTQTCPLFLVKLSWTHFCLMRVFTRNKLNSKWGISITNTCTVEIK